MLEGINQSRQAKLNAFLGAGSGQSVKKTDQNIDIGGALNGSQTRKNNFADNILGSNVGKVVTTVNADGSKTEKTFDRSGKCTKEVVYKDVNGDGKEDIYSVTDFYEADTDPVDGHKEPAKTKTFIDEDGDGYYDTIITKTFDEKGKLKTEEKTYEENINDVKNRNHMDYEIYNRKMTAHKDGVYMM